MFLAADLKQGRDLPTPLLHDENSLHWRWLYVACSTFGLHAENINCITR